MIGFDEWARGGPRELDGSVVGPYLEIGAALVARDAYPDVSVPGLLARLDAIARPLDRLALHRAPVETAARALAQHLYEVHGFRGNEAEYGDPRNSYLNEVLDRRLGIPITLAIVLMGVARRLSVPARGVSFPGHFLVRFERANGGPLIVDPFHGGRALSVEELTRLLRRASGPSTRLQLKHIEPASTRAIMVRVLSNLRAAHTARGDLPNALVAATRIVSLAPGEAWAIRDRGVLQAKLGAPASARADLLRYLELAPDANDAKAIRKMVDELSAKRVSAPN